MWKRKNYNLCFLLLNVLSTIYFSSIDTYCLVALFWHFMVSTWCCGTVFDLIVTCLKLHCNIPECKGPTSCSVMKAQNMEHSALHLIGIQKTFVGLFINRIVKNPLFNLFSKSGCVKCTYFSETNMSVTFKKFQLYNDLEGQADWCG